MEGLSAQISDWEAEEAIRSIRAGDNIEAVAPRYGLSTKTMTRIIKRAERREKEARMADNTNALGQTNDALLEELRRLQGIELDNPDALRLEISRAKAIEGIAKATIENANTVMSVARMQAERVGASHVSVPKMLAN